MAGLTAAARAARDGLSVLVTDIADDVGGSARFAGYAWTAPSHEVMDRTGNPCRASSPRARTRVGCGTAPTLVGWPPPLVFGLTAAETARQAAVKPPSTG